MSRLWKERAVWFFLLVSASGVTWLLLTHRPTPSTPPEPAPPLNIQNATWRIGEAAELTLTTLPPRDSATITLTLLAPGSGQPPVKHLASDFFGLSGVQLLWLSPEQQKTEIALAAATGVHYLGLDFDWRRLEPERGQYVWTETDAVVALAKQHDLRLVPMLLYTPRWASSADFAPLDYQRAPPTSYADYRDFVYAVVSRYKPHGLSPVTATAYGISDWVIWNEPNVSRPGEAPHSDAFWTGDLEAYLQLLRAGYEGAHAADPNANVLNGALADIFWIEGKPDVVKALERLYDPNGDGNAADGGRPFFDTLNVHTYQLSEPTATWYQERLQALVKVMERFGDSHKRIWITETGYGSTATPAADSNYVSEAAQADAVSLIYTATATQPQVERVFWWNLRDYYRNTSATNPAMEAHYGLLRSNFSPKPAYVAYAQLTGRVGQVLTLQTTTDQSGVSRVTIPASFIVQPGTYVVFANLDETQLTAVTTYTVPIP
jgi:polysaccharide biosynthesis protein PslG